MSEAPELAAIRRSLDELAALVMALESRCVELIEAVHSEQQGHALRRLPPMRAPFVTLLELNEVVEAASSQTKAIPSERVKEVLERVMNKEKVAQMETAQTEQRSASVQLKVLTVSGIIVFVFGMIATFLLARLTAR